MILLNFLCGITPFHFVFMMIIEICIIEFKKLYRLDYIVDSNY